MIGVYPDDAAGRRLLYEDFVAHITEAGFSKDGIRASEDSLWLVEGDRRFCADICPALPVG